MYVTCIMHVTYILFRGGSRILEWGGAQVERRRREYRGAAGAEGGYAPFPEIFLTLLLGIVHFRAYYDTISHVHKAYSRLKEKQTLRLSER